MEELPNRQRSTIDSIATLRVLDERIKTSLDRIFDWHLASDPPPQLSFGEIIETLVHDPNLIGPAKVYLTEAPWAQDADASESALQRLAWALVENFAKVPI